MLTKLNLYQRCVAWTFAIIFCFSIQILTAQTQQKKWFLEGREIDFSVTPPLVTDITSAASSNDLPIATNGFYNQEGTRLFNLSNDRVINRFGNTIATLSPSSDGHSSLERGIVPIAGECGKLFIIRNTYGIAPGLYLSSRLSYSEIDLEANDGAGSVTAELTDTQ